VSRGARAFHRHAQALLDHELHRARGRLTEIPVERRLVVEVYDGEPVPELRAVSCVAD
jgi:hypothetical protein